MASTTINTSIVSLPAMLGMDDIVDKTRSPKRPRLHIVIPTPSAPSPNAGAYTTHPDLSALSLEHRHHLIGRTTTTTPHPPVISHFSDDEDDDEDEDEDDAMSSFSSDSEEGVDDAGSFFISSDEERGDDWAAPAMRESVPPPPPPKKGHAVGQRRAVIRFCLPPLHSRLSCSSPRIAERPRSPPPHLAPTPMRRRVKLPSLDKKKIGRVGWCF